MTGSSDRPTPTSAGLDTETLDTETLHTQTFDTAGLDAEDDRGDAHANTPVQSPNAPPRQVRHRSEWEIRWRQARNAPPPVVRAVLANIAVAFVAGIVLLLTDWLAGRGAIPGYLQDLGPLLYVVVVIVSGSLFTYLWVELPTGVPGEKRRSPWAGVLGFFASIPIVYLALVIIFELLRPLLP